MARLGEFLILDCAILTKIKKGAGVTRTLSVGKGKTHFFSLLGVYEGFDKEKPYGDQDEELYDMWEREWDVYSMIIDFYDKYPDENVKIVHKAVDSGDDDENDGKLLLMGSKCLFLCCN